MKVVTLFSGGLDSTTLAYMFNSEPTVRCQHLLSIDYGQRHKAKELASAKRIASLLVGVPWRVLEVPFGSILRGSCLTDSSISVPEGHYSDPIQANTVVPNRNMILLSIAAAYASSIGFDTIAYAPHRGDAAIYPDCRPDFVRSMQGLLELSLGSPMRIRTPFLQNDKREIVRIARRLGVPIELTWSCYVGCDDPCGKCGACIERAEALAE